MANICQHLDSFYSSLFFGRNKNINLKLNSNELEAKKHHLKSVLRIILLWATVESKAQRHKQTNYSYSKISPSRLLSTHFLVSCKWQWKKDALSASYDGVGLCSIDLHSVHTSSAIWINALMHWSINRSIVSKKETSLIPVRRIFGCVLCSSEE